jgi:hypothetical protein
MTTLDLARLFPVERHDSADAERATLGALITGALAWRDVAHLEGDDFYFASHVELLCALQAAAELRPSRRAGIALAWAVRAARATGCALGESYVVSIARSAPRRLDALAAVAELRALRIEREETAQRRARAVEAFTWWAGVAAAFLLASEEDREIARATEPIEELRERRGTGPSSGRRAA